MAAKKKTFVYPVADLSAVGSLRALLRELDCVELVDDLQAADVVVMLMGVALPPDSELRRTLSPAADGDFELVGVHAPDGDGTIPAVMEDWTTGGFYRLDQAELRAGICGGDEGWMDKGGTPRLEPKTERECSKRNC